MLSDYISVYLSTEKGENAKMQIRRIGTGDEKQVSNLIRKTIFISNTKDYPKELMDALIAVETPEPDEEHLIRMEKNK